MVQEEYDILYLHHDEINFIKWDNCINNSHNGNIYALSWYLDIICEEWSALVCDDYESVMPVLHKERGNLKYTYTTYLANQLGVFSTYILDQNKVNAFVDKLASVYRHFFVNLNKFNKVDPELYRQKSLSTYEFDLIGDYQTIQNRYTEQNKEDLKISKREKVTVIRGMLPNEFLEFASETNVLATSKLKSGDIQKLRKIVAFILRHGLGDIYSAYDHTNTLVAAMLFLKSNRKINILFSVITQDGVAVKAMNQMVDHYIQKNAGKNLTLNFENLAMPDKPAFCTGFGAKEYYFTHVWNAKIPWYTKIINSLP